MRILIAASALALASCYSPTPRDCEILCGSDGACPDGTTCSGGFCNHPGAPPDACCRPPENGVIYVDAAQTHSSTGNATCPFRTITAALAVAQTSPAPPVSIHVAPGRYDESLGEKFPLIVRGAVSIIGAGDDKTIIEGIGAFDHSVLGGALSFCCIAATIVAGDDTGLQRIAGVSVRSGASVPPPPTVPFGILCDRGNAAHVGLPQPATPNLTVDRVVIAGGYEFGMSASNSNTSGCQLSLTDSSIDHARGGMWLVANGTTGVGGPDVAATVRGNLFRDLDKQPAVLVWGSVAELVLQDNRVELSAAGAIFAQDDPRQRMTVTGNTFSMLDQAGVVVRYGAVIERLENNVFEGISSVVHFTDLPSGALVIMEQGAVTRARANRFIGNHHGVLLTGSPLQARPMDFGTAGDHGNNVFRCNAARGGSGEFDLLVDASGGSLPFAGNHWDHVPPTFSKSAAAPNGTDIVSLLATIVSDGATLATEACPADRMP